MKLITFFYVDKERIGALLPCGHVLDFSIACQELAVDEQGDFQNMLNLIDAWESALCKVLNWIDSPPGGTLLDAREVEILAPIPKPPQMRDFMAFEKHLSQSLVSVSKLNNTNDQSSLEETSQLIPSVWYEQPIYYKCNRFAVCGTNTEIKWPSYSNIMDYELELAVVIGKRGKNIGKHDASDYIFGYTLFNDLTARDAQLREIAGGLGPAKGKDFDNSNVLGPCIVTRDEISDPYQLTMIARVNGEERSRGSSSSMHWSFEEMIEHVSREETLYPGEILGSGTVENGCGLEQLRFLNDGDVVELEIEGIGKLVNRVSQNIEGEHDDSDEV